MSSSDIKMAKKPAISNLPVEIITDILLRLSIKTLCASKCVCKTWRSLVSTPHFTKTHKTKHQNEKPNSGTVAVPAEDQIFLRTDSLFTLALTDLLLQPPPLTKLDPLRNSNPNRFMDVIGTSGGLICLFEYPNSFFLLNPTTRESVMIRPDPDYYGKICGFGYVSVVDDYRIVKVVSSSMLRVYSVKSDSWKVVLLDFPYGVNAYSGKKCMYVNGVVHWLVSCANDFLCTAIVGFDFVEEKFKGIMLPGDIKPKERRPIFVGNLGVLGGFMCMTLEVYPECIELWIMLEYGVRDKWSKLLTVPYYTGSIALKGMLPVGILSGQLLFQVDRRYLFLFDHVNVQRLEVWFPPGPCCKFGTTVYDVEEPCCAFGAIVYEKSLVSPRGYFWLDESEGRQVGRLGREVN